MVKLTVIIQNQDCCCAQSNNGISNVHGIQTLICIISSSPILKHFYTAKILPSSSRIVTVAESGCTVTRLRSLAWSAGSSVIILWDHAIHNRHIKGDLAHTVTEWTQKEASEGTIVTRSYG